MSLVFLNMVPQTYLTIFLVSTFSRFDYFYNRAYTIYNVNIIINNLINDFRNTYNYFSMFLDKWKNYCHKLMVTHLIISFCLTNFVNIQSGVLNTKLEPDGT